MIGHRDLAVPTGVGRQRELHPCRVVRLVLFEERARRVRRRHEVIVRSVRDSREVDLLTVRCMVVLVDPTRLDTLVARVAIPEHLPARGRVAREVVEVEETEPDFDGIPTNDRACGATLPDLELRDVRRVPVVMGRVVLECRHDLLGEHRVARIARLRLRAAEERRVRRADLLDRVRDRSGSDRRIRFDTAIRIDLSKAVKAGEIDTLGNFFQEVIQAAEDLHGTPSTAGQSAAWMISDKLGVA